MWKILTAQIREEIYYTLTSLGFFPEEQRGCRKGSRGKAELIDIDQHILNESKTGAGNLAMAWIDYKMEYDMVLQSWIINYLKMESKILSRKPSKTCTSILHTHVCLLYSRLLSCVRPLTDLFIYPLFLVTETSEAHYISTLVCWQEIRVQISQVAIGTFFLLHDKY